MTKGWRGNSRGHSLAARGIKTIVRSRAVTRQDVIVDDLQGRENASVFLDEFGNMVVSKKFRDSFGNVTTPYFDTNIEDAQAYSLSRIRSMIRLMSENPELFKSQKNIELMVTGAEIGRLLINGLTLRVDLKKYEKVPSGVRNEAMDIIRHLLSSELLEDFNPRKANRDDFYYGMGMLIGFHFYQAFQREREEFLQPAPNINDMRRFTRLMPIIATVPTEVGEGEFDKFAFIQQHKSLVGIKSLGSFKGMVGFMLQMFYRIDGRPSSSNIRNDEDIRNIKKAIESGDLTQSFNPKFPFYKEGKIEPTREELQQELTEELDQVFKMQKDEPGKVDSSDPTSKEAMRKLRKKAIAGELSEKEQANLETTKKQFDALGGAGINNNNDKSKAMAKGIIRNMSKGAHPMVALNRQIK